MGYMPCRPKRGKDTQACVFQPFSIPGQKLSARHNIQTVAAVHDPHHPDTGMTMGDYHGHLHEGRGRLHFRWTRLPAPCNIQSRLTPPFIIGTILTHACPWETILGIYMRGEAGAILGGFSTTRRPSLSFTDVIQTLPQW